MSRCPMNTPMSIKFTLEQQSQAFGELVFSLCSFFLVLSGVQPVYLYATAMVWLAPSL